jgi:hypothetical protein
MEGYVRAHPQRREHIPTIEPLEDRTLLSAVGLLDHLPVNASPFVAWPESLANHAVAVVGSQALLRNGLTVTGLTAVFREFMAERDFPGLGHFEQAINLLDHPPADASQFVAWTESLANHAVAAASSQALLRNGLTIADLTAVFREFIAERDFPGLERLEQMAAELKAAQAFDTVYHCPTQNGEECPSRGHMAASTTDRQEPGPASLSADAPPENTMPFQGKGVDALAGVAVAPHGAVGEIATDLVGLAPAVPPSAIDQLPRGDPFPAIDVPPADDPEQSGLFTRVGVLLESGLPFDLPILRQDVDEFFARLSAIGQGNDDWPGYARFGPWLIVLTAVALEAARRWERKFSRRAVPGCEVVLGPANLLTEDQ